MNIGCTNCYKPHINIKCPQCKITDYCSRACMATHRSVHANACVILNTSADITDQIGKTHALLMQKPYVTLISAIAYMYHKTGAKSACVEIGRAYCIRSSSDIPEAQRDGMISVLFKVPGSPLSMLQYFAIDTCRHAHSLCCDAIDNEALTHTLFINDKWTLMSGSIISTGS